MMPLKKTIAIVGATEKTGTDFASHLAHAGYHLLLISRDAAQLKQLSKRISRKNTSVKIDAIECVKDGCWEADIIILAVTADEEKQAARAMKEVATQKIVATISNQKNLEDGLQQILPYSKLVKVYHLTGKDLLISGDQEEANEEIEDIFHRAGYRPAIIDNNRK